MISEIRPKSYQRYVSLPVLGPVLDEFTTWSRQRGYAVSTIRNQLRDVLHIEAFVQERGARKLQDLAHDDFEEAWKHFHSRWGSIGGTIHLIERFLEETYELKPPLPGTRSPICSELDRFAGHLRDVRGLKACTIRCYVGCLRRFLEHVGYDEDTGVLARLTLREVDAFLGQCALRLQRHSLQRVIVYLRAFLRFQHEQGVTGSPLHTMIDSPRIYRLERLPRSLPWDTVQALLASIDRSEPHGIRDYTMLFLMTTYGLRSCEVVSLTLDDIDWRAGVIRISQQKTGNHLMLPLTDEAGQVVVEYLEKARPKLNCRELFLRLHAPYGPLQSTAVRHVFGLRVSLSGLDIQQQGAHCIRHSFAVHLLRQGTPLKTIGDLLGHKNVQSTCAYLRLSTEDLRNVALPVPDGPEVEDPLDLVALSRRPKNRCRKKQGATPPRPPESFLASDIENFVNLKRSLGYRFREGEHALRMLDAFLADSHPLSDDLTPEIFNGWCSTMCGLSRTTRHRYMLVVRNLCLYRRRFDAHVFAPNEWTFPDDNQKFVPFILPEADVARILSATRFLRPCCNSPLRAQTIRIGVLLLYTTGMRCGELVNLRLADFNSSEGTLLLRNAKFHKARIVPLSPSVITEVEEYLDLRRGKRLPVEMSSPLMLSGCGTPGGSAYTETGLRNNWTAVCTAIGILTSSGKAPRLHDLRHSFAVNALKRWYEAGVDVGTRLPMLSTYMGHACISSTHYYISFIEGIQTEASARFHDRFGMAITSGLPDSVSGHPEDLGTGGVR